MIEQVVNCERRRRRGTIEHHREQRETERENGRARTPMPAASNRVCLQAATRRRRQVRGCACGSAFRADASAPPCLRQARFPAVVLAVAGAFKSISKNCTTGCETAREPARRSCSGSCSNAGSATATTGNSSINRRSWFPKRDMSLGGAACLPRALARAPSAIPGCSWGSTAMSRSSAPAALRGRFRPPAAPAAAGACHTGRDPLARGCGVRKQVSE